MQYAADRTIDKGIQVGQLRTKVAGRLKAVLGENSSMWESLHRSAGVLLPASAFTTSTWSHRGEDLVAAGFLPEASGSYVDVGMSHPVRANNTWSFYQRGWHGVCVEPIARHVEIATRRRKRDRIVRAAAGVEEGQLTFFRFENEEYSTADADVARALIERGERLVDQESVQVVTLAGLGVRATPDEPTLLSLDVEGGEMAVLQGNDWGTYLPRVICVEEWESPIDEHTEVRALLESEGYVLRAYLNPSAIYVHESYSEDGR